MHFDQKLWAQDIRGSIAHARMLGRQGIIDKTESEQLIQGLEQVGRELAKGEFVFDPAAEDIHMNIEKRLFEVVGEVAGKLHTGRSRNDQVATDLLLWMRDQTVEIRAALLGLRQTLIERAEQSIDVVLPGYTHLQRAQPVRLAHHWLAHASVLARDDGRVRDAAARMRHSPLGSGALAGTTLSLDRESTARELGFDAPTANSLDAVSSRDAALELLAALAIIMTHLSRLSEELVLWNTTEFGFIEMDDAFATGSSLMPQKKNPDVPELVRGKSGRVIGDLVSLLVTLKGLPLSYNRDLQEDKEPLFDAVETTTLSLEILSATLRTLRVNRERMAEAASDPMLLATDLAEYLVERGVAFREAHGIVGDIVRHAVDANTPLSALSRETLLGFHAALDIEPREFFAVERSLEARSLTGGPAREAVERTLESLKSDAAATAAEIEETRG